MGKAIVQKGCIDLQLIQTTIELVGKLSLLKDCNNELAAKPEMQRVFGLVDKWNELFITTIATPRKG